jgi:DNA polymerase-3 subunit delta
MKVATRDQGRFLQSAESKVAAVLFYGPDQGLVRERALDLVTRIAGDAADPFRVAELSAAQLKDDPARLADEAAALSLSGGRRVLRLREAADAHAEALDELLVGPPPASFLVLEAGELAPRSALRKVFEGSNSAAAIACYLDDEDALARLVQDSLKARGLSIEARAQAYLVAHLGGDRGVSRQELEKLALYLGEGTSEVTLDDVSAVIGDSSVASLDDCIFALGDGDRAGIDRGYARALDDGNDEISILRAAGRHIMRLHQVAAASDPREAMRTLRPPVFYKFESRFLAQLRLWSPQRLGEALSRLNRAEIDIKTNAQPKSAIAERALLDVAGLARAGQAKAGVAVGRP